MLSLPVASCRFLSPCYFLPGAFLSLSCRSPVVPSCRSPVVIPCCLPVPPLFLSLVSSCRLPVAPLSPPCRLAVAQRGNLSHPCRLPVACLSLASPLLSPPCRLPVASLSPNVLPCCIVVACLSLSSRLPVAYLSLPFRLPVACLLPFWRFLGRGKCCFFQRVSLLMQNRLQFIFHMLPFYPFFSAAQSLPMQQQLEHTVYLCSCPAKKCPLIHSIPSK